MAWIVTPRQGYNFTLGNSCDLKGGTFRVKGMADCVEGAVVTQIASGAAGVQSTSSPIRLHGGVLAAPVPVHSLLGAWSPRGDNVKFLALGFDLAQIWLLWPFWE